MRTENLPALMKPWGTDRNQASSAAEVPTLGTKPPSQSKLTRSNEFVEKRTYAGVAAAAPKAGSWAGVPWNDQSPTEERREYFLGAGPG
jgi:hypothetical protein